MIIHLRELKCPLCGGKDLERLDEDKYRCRFCGLRFVIVDIVEEDKGEVLDVDIAEANVEYHHITSRVGESALITCPHCGREIYLWLRAPEGDPDWISIAVIKGDQEVLDKVKIPPEDEEDEEDEH